MHAVHPHWHDLTLQLFKNVAERGKWTRLFVEAEKVYSTGDLDSALLMYLLLAEMGMEVAQSNAAYILEQGAWGELVLDGGLSGCSLPPHVHVGNSWSTWPSFPTGRDIHCQQQLCMCTWKLTHPKPIVKLPSEFQNRLSNTDILGPINLS